MIQLYLFPGVFCSKIVDNECEGDGFSVVLTQARWVETRVVAVWDKALLKLVVSYFTGLFQSVHT